MINNYFYNKSIIFDFELVNSFIKIIIENNKIIKCDENKIKLDIKSKLDKINLKIEYIEFYTSLYDYEIIKNNVYWDTIKHLDIDELPIYKKNKNLLEFFEWTKKNFNNNKIKIYETSKFTKRITNFTPSEEKKCLESIKYSNINIKFKNFNQIFFHAGDKDDIERFGYLYIRSLYFKHKIIEITKNNVFYDDNFKIWDKFNITFESITNTMNYMFEQMKKGILVGIKNNKLAIFLPFSNNDYTNDFYTELYFDENDKKNLLEYKNLLEHKNSLEHKNIEKIKSKLSNTLIYYLNKYKLSTKNIIIDRRKWTANDCFFRYENYEGDKSEALFEDFLIELCKNRTLPDCIFFINLRDHPMLNKNFKNSYTNLINKQLDKKYINDTYAPILSQGCSTENVDIPICTQDDWLRISKKIYPDDCKNGYLNEIKNINWNEKKNKAVFRGSATGCKINMDNPRIKASYLSEKYPEYLDAGITSFNRKLKKNLNMPLQVINTDIKKANFMTLEEKATYKYILNLEGHVSAFRLGHEFSLGSVLLIQKSKYYLWFSHLLEPMVHYIPINENLDNLIEQIKWCIDNDDKCKKIANNGINFYKKYLEKDGIYDYMQNILYKLPFNSLKFKMYKERIAIITIYRNKADNTRLQQKRLFTYWMNKILYQTCEYDIIIVEQSEKYLFNIGKLKNIGFDYLNKYSNQTYSNYIFADIDTIPDSNLIDYFFKHTDSLNSIATFGTRYEDIEHHNRPFAGALISCSKSIFEELNGYPNNFYGWGGEDTDLLIRLFAINKPLYINKIGKVIDIEEVAGFKKKLGPKLNSVKYNNEKESQMYEKNYNWKNFMKNGLTNLNYKILYENKSNYFDSKNYHIIVDVEYDEDVKKYPSDYIFTKEYSRDDHHDLLNSTSYTLKQIKF